MNPSDTARRLRAGALTALAFHAFAAPVALAAQDAPRLTAAPLLAGEGVSDKSTAKFLQLLTDELKTRDDDLRWVPMPRAGGGGAPAATTKKAPSSEAVAAIVEGNKLMDELKFEDAVDLLQKGVDAELVDPATADFKEIDAALVKVAAGFFRMGEEKKAQGALYQVARLAPDYKLPDELPAVFRHEFEKARKKVDKAPKGTLAVEGPSGSTVFLNGRDLGMVPVREEDVSAGWLFVRVDGPHGERFGQAVELKGGTVKVRANFGGAVAQTTGAVELKFVPTLDADTAYRAARLCKSAELDFALVGYVFRTGEHKLTISAALYSARRQGFARLNRYEFDDEVLTANVEAFHLADDVVAKLKSFEVDPLPIGLGAPSTAVAVAEPPRRPAQEKKVVTVEPKREETARDVPKKEEPAGTRVRVLPRKSELVDSHGVTAVAGEPSGGVGKDGKSSGVPWWVWVAAGVVVVGAAGGGYYGYTQATTPVTGTAKASWK